MGDVSPPSGTGNDHPTPQQQQQQALAAATPTQAGGVTATATATTGGASAIPQDQGGYSFVAYGSTDPQAPFSSQFQQQQGQYREQQHAYSSSQYDMAQQQALGRATGPYNMGMVMNALPQQQPGFRPGQAQGQGLGQGQGQVQGQGQRYNNTMPPGASATMAASQQTMQQAVAAYAGAAAAAMNAMNAIPGQPAYYMPQHGAMPPYYGASPQPQQQQEAMSPTRATNMPNMPPTLPPNMAFYPQNAGAAPYYYAHAGHFPGQGQGVMQTQQYMPQPGAQGDHRMVHQQHQQQHHHPHPQHVHHHQQQQQHHMAGPSGANYTQPSGQGEGVKATESRSSVVRGPPRKPRQSGHAIWIGNLPPQTDLMSLVYHVCKEARGLESLFLISKSNCAFANFKDEQACLQAQQKLHDSKFQAVRLVSRLRKSTVEGASGITAPTGPASASSPRPPSTVMSQDAPPAPTAVDSEKDDGSVTAGSASVPGTTSSQDAASTPQTQTGVEGSTPQKDRYFILKSLTVEDLELSVQTGIWATQSHNEKSLNSAFQSADNVYLVFSANKSGEYFGFARMTSPINEDPSAAIEFAPKAQSAADAGLPKAIPTEPTEFAPRGSIMDDSERGTIFWEADLSPEEQQEDAATVTTEGEGIGAADDAGSTKSGGGGGGGGVSGSGGGPPESKAWGKPFRLEWVSTARLPFYRARGLRNPWNSNREVKIARDGTELEPSVGRRLTSLFPPKAIQGQGQGGSVAVTGGGGAGVRQHQQQQQPMVMMGGAGAAGGYAPPMRPAYQ